MRPESGDDERSVAVDPASKFAPRCLCVDIEVGVEDSRIRRVAGLRADTDDSFTSGSGDLAHTLASLDRLADGAAFILGHNIVAFDLPHLAAANPNLRLLALPVVDTLRLNPLAFPRNPYHHLVKHYQDGQLKRVQVNDPLLDAKLTLELFKDQSAALRETNARAPDLVLAWHWLTTTDANAAGTNAFFATLRRTVRPTHAQAQRAIERLLADAGCLSVATELTSNLDAQGWPLAYALAWLSVAGGNSVMAPWVRHQFPQAGALVRRLRDQPCTDSACRWCRERHSAQHELARYFGFESFRPEPADADGRPLQQAIVEAAMRGEHVLGILPTGTGKSLCYQIPALSRYDKTGALTVVISPLVALMADQVAGLEARGVTCGAALNGLLSMPERADVLDRVRMGDVGILLVAPEQLRSTTFRRALEQREIGAWVLDEAHCLSKWGHDFRPDYRYVARFIKQKAGEGPVPPVLCLTATAKPDVTNDVLAHFHDKLGIDLGLFDGGARRTNLDFAVVPTTGGEKLAHVHQVLAADLPADDRSGAIVFCASRRRTEEIAAYLTQLGHSAAHFHAGLSPERKKETQQAFLRGDLRVIVATNAFGMGIDKPDVRVVIHADIPGSLENYLQEAGRAGRDRDAARCVLLYTPDDVERQFSLSSRARLKQSEIAAILKALRRLNAKKRLGGEVIATPGEILLDEEDGTFVRESATDDTRVRTAVSWLEESTLLTREENAVQVFPSSLRVSNVDEAETKLEKIELQPPYRKQLLALVEALIVAEPDDGVTTDELMAVSGLSPERLRKALYDLETLGIASNDTALTAFVHIDVERASRVRFAEACALESALIDLLREDGADLSVGDSSALHLRLATQRLKDAGHITAMPEKILPIVRGLANDGRGEEGGAGSVGLRQYDPETVQVTLQREWQALERTAELRRAGAGVLLEHLIACAPARRGADLLAETTLGKLLAALKGDLALAAEIRDPTKLLDRALLWLHELEIIRLNKGLAIFRPAMTIRLSAGRRGFTRADFEPLKMHYAEQVVQVHIMAEYAERGLDTIAEAVRLAMDYFTMQRDAFIKRWLPRRAQELDRQTTPASWRAIVESLNNPEQQRIVTDDRERTNVLVLAGPGSGKTRVLVHRIAYLVRVKRENPRGILALAYNRHAAVEIRQRLFALIGDDARGVVVLTCHALAMRLAGASFSGRTEPLTDAAFDDVLKQAVALLNGAGLPPDEADEQRERLLAGFRWILVDEYQDVGPGQYELISALAGRTLKDDGSKLSLFAVGDDDQNIYSFAGASVEYVRRFETDYGARAAYLIENYRSTADIISAANAVIAPARDRMKAAHPIAVDRVRMLAPPGGDWTERDPVGKGRVQVLPAGANPMTQAVAVMTELTRLAALDPHWRWERAAVLAREWKFLEPIRSWCELNRIPVQMADEGVGYFWRLRETQTLIDWARGAVGGLIDVVALRGWAASNVGAWWELLHEAVAAYAQETGAAHMPVPHFLEWLAEWGREIRRRQTGLLLLTAHRAKGLEFDHVVVLDGGWTNRNRDEDPDAARRLYYVAMTRAKATLTLARIGRSHVFLDGLTDAPSVLVRAPTHLPEPAPELARRYEKLGLADVDLGFAGRYAQSSRVHQAIAALKSVDALTLRIEDGKRELVTTDEVCVGRLARGFEVPAGMSCVDAHVAAIVVRTREDSKGEFADSARCDRWEVVVPELVFAPIDK